MSTEEKKRTYLGNGKAVNGYPLVNFSICLSDIPQGVVTESKTNGKKYLNLTIGEVKDGPNEWGYTHTVWINDYKPEPKADSQPQPQRETADLPF
jgi:hypothetical protein